MTRALTCLFGASLFLASIGCSSSSDGGSAPATEEPTLTNVANDVITDTNCGGPLCHSLTAGGFQLGTTKSDLYNALVNQPASGPKCGHALDGGPTPYIRVVPGKPDESLLYMKLKRIQPCGDAMPNSSTHLTDAQIGLVHDWIAAGAKND